MKFEVSWENRLAAIPASLSVLLRPSQAQPGKLEGFPQFSWLLSGVPARRPLVLSLALHILVVLTPVPAFLIATPVQSDSSGAAVVKLEGTGSSRFLPPVYPVVPRKRVKGSRGHESEVPSPRRPDRVQQQTIISRPLEANHPRQTFLRRETFENVPIRRTNPRLPNFVIPPGPDLSLAAELPELREPSAAVSSPEVSGESRMPPRPKSDAELALESTRLENFIPRLTAAPAQLPGPSSLPEVQTSAGARREGDLQAPRLLALSSQPAPPRPLLELPTRNLKARFAAGPSPGTYSPAGVPGGRPGASGGSDGSPGGMDSGVGELVAPDVLVAPVDSAPSGPVSGGPVTGNSLPAPPPEQPASNRTSPAKANPEKSSTRTPQQRARAMWRAVRGEGPSPGRIQTTHLYLPDLTSQSSSWRLQFLERDRETPASPLEDGGNPGHLRPPQVVRKADPCYPAEGHRERVEGTVVLYGVIEANGKLSDVVVVQGLTPELDQRAAQALRRSRFEPARKNRRPVAVEALIEIPFRLAPCL